MNRFWKRFGVLFPAALLVVMQLQPALAGFKGQKKPVASDNKKSASDLTGTWVENADVITVSEKGCTLGHSDSVSVDHQEPQNRVFTVKQSGHQLLFPTVTTTWGSGSGTQSYKGKVSGNTVTLTTTGNGAGFTVESTGKISPDGNTVTGNGVCRTPRGPATANVAFTWTRKATTRIRETATKPPERKKKIYAIFVSGFSSLLMGGSIKQYEMGFQKSHPDIKCFYHPWDDETGILHDINTAPKDAIVRVIGHSYGGDTSTKIVGEATHPVETLILVDPVSRIPVADYPTQSNKRIGNTTKPLPSTWAQRVTERIQKAKNHVTGQFIDIDAMPGENEDFTDIVAYIGGKWDTLPEGKVDIFLSARDRNHTNYKEMIEATQSQLGGESLINLMAKPISQ